MIQNEKQYKISKNRLAEMNEIIRKKGSKVKPDSKEEAVIISIHMIRNQIKEEIKAYENLRNSKVLLKKTVSLVQLPQLLIQHKIAKGLTQKEFSAILGIKEQQLQRYEAEQYASVSFKRLLSFIEKTKLHIIVAIK